MNLHRWLKAERKATLKKVDAEVKSYARCVQVLVDHFCTKYNVAFMSGNGTWIFYVPGREGFVECHSKGFTGVFGEYVPGSWILPEGWTPPRGFRRAFFRMKDILDDELGGCAHVAYLVKDFVPPRLRQKGKR